MRRERTTLLVALLGLAAGCGGGGRELLVYSPHGRDHLRAYEEGFEAENPGIDVLWVDMGSQEILDRVRSERANPQADIWFGAPSDMFDRAAEEGLLAPYRPVWADGVPEEERAPGDEWTGLYRTPEVIAFNDEAVAPEDVPRTWDAVLDPRWDDEIVIRDPLASGTMRTVFAAIIYREYERTGTIEAGYDWLLRLDAHTREYVLNPTILYQKLSRREGLITLWNMPDIEILRATTDFPIDYVLPEDGTPVVIDAVGIVAGTDEPEMARRFVDFVGTEESLRIAAERFFRIPVRTDVDLSAMPEWLREALPRIRPMPLDREFIRERAPEWLRHWDREIRGRGDRHATRRGSSTGFW